MGLAFASVRSSARVAGCRAQRSTLIEQKIHVGQPYDASFHRNSRHCPRRLAESCWFSHC